MSLLQLNFDDSKPIKENKDVKENKGRLIIGPVYSAFKKIALGSIPTKEEIVIVKKESNQYKGFNSSIKRFANETFLTADKTLLLNNTYDAITNNPINKKEITRTVLNNNYSKSNRFSDYTLYKKMYSPGPGEYKTNNNQHSYSFRYDKLFKQQSQEGQSSNIIKSKVLTKNKSQVNLTINNNFSHKQPKIFKKIRSESVINNSFNNYSSRGESDFFIDKRKIEDPGPGTYDISSITRKPLNKITLNKKEKSILLTNKELNTKILQELKLTNDDPYTMINDKITFFKLNNRKSNYHKLEKTKINKLPLIEKQKELNKIKSNLEEQLTTFKKETMKQDFIFISKVEKLPNYKNHIPGPAFYSKSPKLKDKLRHNRLK